MDVSQTRDQFYMKIGFSDKNVNFVDIPSFKCNKIVDRIESLADINNIKKTDKDKKKTKCNKH